MPFVPCENTALVETRMSYALQKVENTIWVQSDSAWDAGSLLSLAGIVKIWWTTHYNTLVSGDLSLRQVVATDQSSDTGPQATLDGGATAGEAEGLSYPGNVSLTISFRTGGRGRSMRGRNYIVGIPTSAESSINEVSTAYTLDWITVYEALKTALDDEGYTWVVASRFSGIGGTPPKPIPREAGVMTPITSVVVVDTIFDSQRRRLTGRGQ